MSKRIDQLTLATETQVQDLTWLHIIGDPATGQLYHVTGSQLKTAFTPQKYLYTTTGAEGDTLTIPTVNGVNILYILREGGTTLYEVDSSPDSLEFVHSGNTITLGTPVSGQAGERFLIIYTNV